VAVEQLSELCFRGKRGGANQSVGRGQDQNLDAGGCVPTFTKNVKVGQPRDCQGNPARAAQTMRRSLQLWDYLENGAVAIYAASAVGCCTVQIFPGLVEGQTGNGVKTVMPISQEGV
jgi:hypothetical protein